VLLQRLTHERQGIASKASSQQELDAAEALAVAEAEPHGLVQRSVRTTATHGGRAISGLPARLHDTNVEAHSIPKRDRDVGDVDAGSSVLQLVSLDEMWISAWVDETGCSAG
jgi:HlyD family secretion protein